MIHPLSAAQYRDSLTLADITAVDGIADVKDAFSFRISSWSMYPTLQKGDVVEIAPTDPVEPGDIVVFRQAGSLVCHRVIGTGPELQLRTCGDACVGEGEIVERAQVVGRVDTVRRAGRRLNARSMPVASTGGAYRMRLSRAVDDIKERAMALLGWILDFLVGLPWLRRAVRRVIDGRINFAVGFPAPVRTVRAYQFMEIGRVPIQAESLHQIQRRIGERPGLVLRARWGRFLLGTSDLATGEVEVRRAVWGLGLEELFVRAADQLRGGLQQGSTDLV